MLWKVMDGPCPWVDMVLRDDSITRGLDDGEARLLVEWLADVALDLWRCPNRHKAEQTLRQLLRRCRGIKRFVILWYHDHETGPAAQLAEAESFQWPLPRPDESDPTAVLERILSCERPPVDLTSTSNFSSCRAA